MKGRAGPARKAVPYTAYAAMLQRLKRLKSR
jgi:hypothetical protein